MLKPRWIDVSVGLHTGMPHWPGNPPVKIARMQDMEHGGHSNVSALSMGSHTGTHVDAPVHFLKGGAGIDRMPFEATNGPARVVAIRSRELISSKELVPLRLRRGERVLFKTVNSARCWKKKSFVKDFVYLSTEAGEYLARRGVRTIGVDYLSVGGFHKNGGEIHRVLLEAGITIIEGLDLSAARPGRCELACLALKITGGDGAPARAMLRIK
jgi:arylformamidase